jgi:CRISPR-associated protein Cas5/CasD subtype I-E
MWIRIDRPGTTLTDYHTVGPREGVETVPTGSGKPWRINKLPQTLQTWRVYLADAAFLWLATGPAEAVTRLKEALSAPFWQLSLGRKACVPDFPLVLGSSDLAPAQALAAVPAVGGPGPRRVHRFTATRGGATSRAYADWALGAHPHDGYGYRWRETNQVAPATVACRTDLLTWAKENLT